MLLSRSLTVQDWLAARRDIAAAGERRGCPQRRSALIGSGRELSGKGVAKRQARHFAPQKISGPFRQIAGRRSERLRKALDLTLADTGIDLCGMWPPKHT